MLNARWTPEVMTWYGGGRTRRGLAAAAAGCRNQALRRKAQARMRKGVSRVTVTDDSLYSPSSQGYGCQGGIVCMSGKVLDADFTWFFFPAKNPKICVELPLRA